MKHINKALNLAFDYLRRGNNTKAIGILENAIKQKNGNFETHNLLGHLYMLDDNPQRALPLFIESTKLNPLFAEGLYNLGACYIKLEKYDKALGNFKKNLKLSPNNSATLNNIGVVLARLGKQEESANFYIRAVRTDPQNTSALFNLGVMYMPTDPKKAASYFEKVLSINSNSEKAHYNLAICLKIINDIEGSIYHFKKALEINPNHPPTYGQLYHTLRSACDWKQAEELESQILKIDNRSLRTDKLPAETAFMSVIYEENPDRNFKIAQAWSKNIETKVAASFQKYNFIKRTGKIRIGYLSSDFKDHATSQLMMGVFKSSNKKLFDIYLYSYGEDDKSGYRGELEKTGTFRNVVSYSSEKTADLIYKDKIDILIDLKGYTANNRLEILALKPAPVQITYLGFPGTTGADFVDYLITDKVVTPPLQNKYFSEKLIFLPNCYQANNNRQKIANNNYSKQSMGLPKEGFIFASFNHNYKIDRMVFSLWMKILKAVPNSVLWLLKSNHLAENNLKIEAQCAGIEPNRLIFAEVLPKPEHLARTRLADLALDTFTCNGHTTTSDCLWAGVPVVTKIGGHFASRVSASLLTAVGLPELITKTPEEYEKLILSLAKNPKKLNAIRHSLITKRLTEPLFDTERFTKNLEKAYGEMWRIYLSGKKPKSITIKD